MEAERVNVQGSPTRCPICHDACRSAEPNVVCHACLARHHTECWEGHGACGACACAEGLQALQGDSQQSPQPSAGEAPRRFPLLGLALLAIAIAGVLYAYRETSHPSSLVLGITVMLIPAALGTVLLLGLKPPPARR